MRQAPFTTLTAANNASTNGPAIKVDQCFAVSVQAISTGTPTGTVKLQASNDPNPAPASTSTFTPTNWSDISGATVNVTTTGAVLIPKTDLCYNFIRAVYTDTAANVATIIANADSSGSLNSKYFLASSKTADYYFWLDDGMGVDPMIAGRTGIQVVYSDNATAATLGGLIRSAAASKGWTVTGSSATAILTDSVVGPVSPAVDVNTGFSVVNTAPAGSTVINMNIQGI